ncbi:pyocin activator PrtN family protein, partial [Pseudomonas aeruginosa]|nr:pyocin activator PrtN family protein [Pseudomonas aeruginosa]
IALPLTTLDPSRKAPLFVDVRHLAALIDSRAWQADEAYARPGSNE